MFSGYDFAAVVALVWAHVVSNYEAVIAGVVFGDNAVSGVTSVATGVWVGIVFLFVHVKPVLVTAPVASPYVVVGLVWDVVWLSFIFKGHCGASGAVVEKGGDPGGGFRGLESIEHFLLSVRCLALFFEEVPSFFDQFPLSFCQSPIPLGEVAKLTVELD
jgi:hypothetical protein